MFDNKKMCLLMMFLLLVLATMFFNKTSIEGHEDLKYDPDDAGQPHKDCNISSVQITPGFEDLYMLKSEAWPAVSTIKAVEVEKETSDELVDGKCPPCPPCARCPEPSFECKKVPNYNVDNNHVPRPILNDFSQFGS
mgnify:FL=1